MIKKGMIIECNTDAYETIGVKRGTRLTVEKITDNGILLSMNGITCAAMDVKEILKNWKEAVPEKPKRQWSKWDAGLVEDKIVDLYPSIDAISSLFVETRTNGKTVEARAVFCNRIVRAKASCNPADEYNFEKGKTIAILRLYAKLVAFFVDMEIGCM